MDKINKNIINKKVVPIINKTVVPIINKKVVPIINKTVVPIYKDQVDKIIINNKWSIEELCYRGN